MDSQDRIPTRKENGIARLIDELLDRSPAGRSPESGAAAECWVKKVLVVSSEYDYFILDEEGRLGSMLLERARREERPSATTFAHTTMEMAEKAFAHGDHEAVLFFNPPSTDAVVPVAKALKEMGDVRTVLVSRGPAAGTECLPGGIDHEFTWSGDGRIFLDILQFLEDSRLSRSNAPSRSRWILIAGRKPHQYSRLVYETYRAISAYMGHVLASDLTRTQRQERSARRPRVILATGGEEASRLCRRHEGSIMCLIAGADMVNDKGAGDLKALVDSGSVPTLMLASDAAAPQGAVCLGMSAHNLSQSLSEFVSSAIGPQTISFSGRDGREISAAADLKELEQALWSLPSDALDIHARNGGVVRWLDVMMEDALASEFSRIIGAVSDAESIRKEMLAALAEQRKASRRGTISTYSRSDGHHGRLFSRIGKGAMGGKARGIAFVDKLVSTYMGDGTVPGMTIKIPRTIVLCTDIFDGFIAENGIDVEGLCNMTDERIAQKFMEGALPAPVLGDIRSFIRDTSCPIVVRSSSLLEDALHHPFAGVYASLLLPNDSWEADLRFQELCACIKYVFASVFFKKARNYMASLQDVSEDEKMGVVIQELVGMKHGQVFYPTLSGVAKSYDYYPSGKCRSTDGVVNLALGLGKEVVDGGTAYRFCPLHPRVPKHGTTADLLDQSQKEFFAVDLTSYVNIVQRNEDSTIGRYPLAFAEQHGSLEHAASTYVHAENRLYPGTGRDGIRVLDFAPILQLETVPLAKVLNALLRMNEMAVGSAVEMEFAMNIPPGEEQPELYVLQVRSMRSTGRDEDVEIGEHEPEDILCLAAHALGNGVIEGIRDIVFVKRDGYDISQNQAIIPQIRRLNEKLMSERTPYILVGPGRWGSTDEWLGIPVNWSDIAGARLIVETPIEERPIDPSQGSHFFHNMVAARTGYLTIMPGTKSIINWDWLDSFEPVEETQNVKHLRLPHPVEIRIDGGKGEGVILKAAPEARDDSNG